MLDGFFVGSRFRDDRTNKQKMEQRIKDSVLNLVLDRDISFLKTARKMNTNIIVNSRDGGIQEFNHNGRKYISFPAEMEKEFESLNPVDAEALMDSYIRLATVPDVKLAGAEESQVNDIFEQRKQKYKDITGLDCGISDDHKNIFQYRAVKKDEDGKEEDTPDNKDDVEEGTTENDSTEVSHKGMTPKGGVEEYQKVELTGSTKKRDYAFQDVDCNPDAPISSELEDNRFFGNKSKLSRNREEKLKALANQIVKAFKGRISKQKTTSVNKRLVSKTLSTDITEKIYVNRKGLNGKHLNINLIIDMSGSMSGTPVKNALEMIYIFNEVAHKGYLTGGVIWSESSSRCYANFPMPREFVKKMGRTGGGEGLAENMEHYFEKLKEADLNICMTDGDITDSPIKKAFYEKHKIKSIGVYVNKDAKDLTSYTGSLDRWFPKSLVRNTTEELCEKLIQLGLRGKKRE